MSLFEDHLKNKHPKFSNEDINHPITPQHIHNYIINTCGDDNIQTFKHKKIDPCLKLLKGCPLMINNNKQLEGNGCGNGSLCRLLAVNLKFGKKPLCHES